MKHLLLITLLSLGCSSTQRQNRQLRLSKLHLLKAEALGAVLDSVKTQVKENLTVSGIHDEESKDRDVNVNALDSLCLELRRQLDSVKNGNYGLGPQMFQFNIPDKNGNFINVGKEQFEAYVKKARTDYDLLISKKFQKELCPDVKKDTVYEQDIIVDGKHFTNKIHIIASSIGGHASLKVDAKPLIIPFVKEDVKVIATPANIPTWWQNLGNHIVLFIAGVVVGAIAMFVIGLVKKIVTIGK